MDGWLAAWKIWTEVELDSFSKCRNSSDEDQHRPAAQAATVSSTTGGFNGNISVLCCSCCATRPVHLLICIDMFCIFFLVEKTKLAWKRPLKSLPLVQLSSRLDQDTTWFQWVVAVDWWKIKRPGIETKIRSCSGSSCSLRQTDIFKPCALTHTVLLLLCGSLVYLLPLCAPGRE